MEVWLAQRVLVIIPLWLSLAVHEWAHAWAANQLGDDTARLQGRMSLDPTVHIDPVGTLILPMIGVPFGWARPVPINPLRIRRVRMAVGLGLAAAAGPLSNLLFAALAVALFHGLAFIGGLDVVPGIRGLLETLVPLNLALALFNLVPVPPLDGSRIMDAVLPQGIPSGWAQVGPIVLIGSIVVLEGMGIGPISALFAWSAWLLTTG